MSKNLQRKNVEIDRKRIPLRSLVHGKEIREAAKALEDFRMKLNEKEFLYGAKLYVDWKDYSSVDIVARRPETDQEYADRLERARIAEEQKRRREAERAATAERKAREAAFRKRAAAVEQIRTMAKEAGLSANELSELISKV